MARQVKLMNNTTNLVKRARERAAERKRNKNRGPKKQKGSRYT